MPYTASIRYTRFGDPVVCVKVPGGVWEYAVPPRQMKTAKRIAYTMARAIEYTIAKNTNGFPA